MTLDPNVIERRQRHPKIRDGAASVSIIEQWTFPGSNRDCVSPTIGTIKPPDDSQRDQTRHTFDLPGLTVGVVRGSEIVYAKGFGVQGIRTQAPLTARSLFHQASISKLFTATAVMQLVERGQVRPDDPVVKYLPIFWLGDERSQSITVEQVLTHTSGMPDPEAHDWEHPEYDEGTLKLHYKIILHIWVMGSHPAIHSNSKANHPFGEMRGIAVVPSAGQPGRRYPSHKPLGDP